MNELRPSSEMSWRRVELGSSRRNVLVIDDFLNEPGRVRREALRLSYRPCGSSYPGLRAEPHWTLDAVRVAISELVGRPIAADSLKAVCSMITFRVDALGADQRRPHADHEDLAGVLYLNLPEQCRGGTGFFRHRRTELEALPRDVDLGLMLRMVRMGIESGEELMELLHAPDPEVAGYPGGSTATWEQLLCVEMRFNRLVLYDGSIFHSAVLDAGDFPEDPEGRRLTLNFFVRDEGTEPEK